MQFLCHCHRMRQGLRIRRLAPIWAHILHFWCALLSTHHFRAKARIKAVQTLDQLRVGRVEPVGIALDAQFDVAAVLGVVDARQAEHLDARMRASRRPPSAA